VQACAAGPARVIPARLELRAASGLWSYAEYSMASSYRTQKSLARHASTSRMVGPKELLILNGLQLQ
jgi:hypothetical protein